MCFFQGSHIKIKTSTEIPVQVDGEPWLQPAGDIVVLKSALKVTFSLNSSFQPLLLGYQYDR